MGLILKTKVMDLIQFKIYITIIYIKKGFKMLLT